MPKIALIIPCYNEEATIKDTITGFKSRIKNLEVIVCDNNSTDDTAAIAKEMKAVVLEELKQGKGYSVTTLFNYCREKQYGKVILVDGDNTYLSDNVNELLEYSGDYDQVIGDRTKEYFAVTKNPIKFFGNKLLIMISRLRVSKDILDPLSGYRIFSRNFINSTDSEFTDFTLETRLNIFSVQNNMKTISVPVKYQNRPENSKSKIKLIDGLKILALTIKGV